MTNERNILIKKQIEELRQKMGGKCAYCETTIGLEFAHIKKTALSGRGRGRKERYYDVIRNMDSYILLCGDEIQLFGKVAGCHTKFDRGEITLEEIIEKKNSRAVLYVEPR